MCAVDPTEQELLVVLDDGREVHYPYASLYALTHAYAATVHKVQGSEFPSVVIVLLMSHAPMLGRTLLYTAPTRARQLVVLVGQKRWRWRSKTGAGGPPDCPGRSAHGRAELRLAQPDGR